MKKFLIVINSILLLAVIACTVIISNTNRGNPLVGMVFYICLFMGITALGRSIRMPMARFTYFVSGVAALDTIAYMYITCRILYFL